MKTISLFVAAFATIFLMVSCTNALIESSTISTDQIRKVELLTKSLEEKLSKGVIQSDVENYLIYRENISFEEIDEITKYPIKDDIYIFIVNLKDGRWFFFSGDYSTSPIIAKGKRNGYHLKNEISRHDQNWFYSIRNMIIKNRTDNSEQTKRNREEWIRANRKAELTAHNNRSEEPDTMEVEILYLLDTLKYENYPNLTSTNWDQSVPWNHAMPKYGINDHCLAGCTVIGLAQLLYYTHYHFGFPNEIYESASCDDYYTAGPPYNFNFSNLTTSSWNQMVLSFSDDPLCYYDPYMPALCALIAQRSNTTYGIDTSAPSTSYDYSFGSTTVSNTVSAMTSFFLYGASPIPYTKANVINEIQNDRPVLTSGTVDPYDTTGHAFLIDGYYWIKLQEREQIWDTNGHLLEENTYISETFYWDINTGNPQHHIQTTEYSYYPQNRITFIGWSQN